jgi:hypothetical protein
MKVCSKCKVSKELSDFHKCSNSKDGSRSSCKECCKKFSIENKERISIQKKEYYLKNKEYIDNRNKTYNNKNKEITNKRSKDYNDNNKEKLIEYRKEYYSLNKEKIDLKNKNYYLDNKDSIIKKQYTYVKSKKETSDLFRLSFNIRLMIHKSFKNSGYSKKSKTYEILGCSFEEFKLHLESKFKDWMNWENKGLYNGELNYGWDIDHIIPLSSVTTEEDIIKLNHYTNLQPLCSKINRDIKKDKLDYEMA